MQCIFPRPWKIVLFISKFGSVSQILSFAFSTLWNIPECSHVTFFSFFGITPSGTSSFCCDSVLHLCLQVLWAVYTESHKWQTCYHSHGQLFFFFFLVIPFVFVQIYLHYRFYFFTSLLSLLSNSFSIICFCKMSHGFVTGREECRTTTGLSVCVWNE